MRKRQRKKHMKKAVDGFREVLAAGDEFIKEMAAISEGLKRLGRQQKAIYAAYDCHGLGPMHENEHTT